MAEVMVAVTAEETAVEAIAAATTPPTTVHLQAE